MSTPAARQALRQAEAEGLTLQPSEGKVGFKGVYFDSRCKARPYVAQVRRVGKHVNLGRFATAEEAALCYARDIAANGLGPRAEKAAAMPAPLTAEEALRQAAADGLTLQPSDGKSAFKGVYFDSSNKTRPYQAKVRRGEAPHACCAKVWVELMLTRRTWPPPGTAASRSAAAISRSSSRRLTITRAPPSHRPPGLPSERWK